MSNAESFFIRCAAKTLSAVDVEVSRSNQHEFGTTPSIRHLLGSEIETPKFGATVVYLSDERRDTCVHDVEITYYDARKNVAHRGPELRCYFPPSPAFSKAKQGDLLVIRRDSSDEITIILCKQGSSVEKAVAHFVNNSIAHPSPAHLEAMIDYLGHRH